MNSKRFLILLAILTAVALGVFAGLSLLPTVGVDGTWLYKWQTIITGGLAIIAGLMTVAVSMLTDRRQHHRHAQIMALSLRPDFLRVQRAAVPRIAALRWLVAGNIEELQEVKTAIASADDQAKMFAAVQLLEAKFVAWRNALKFKGLDEARSLFDARMAESVDEANARIEELGVYWELCRQHSVVGAKVEFKKDGAKYVEKQPQVNEACYQLARQLERLTEAYRNPVDIQPAIYS